MDLQSSLQTQYIGNKYNLLEFYLYKDASGADFYVDAIYIGKSPTTIDENGTQLDNSFDFRELLFCCSEVQLIMYKLFFLLTQSVYFGLCIVFSQPFP